LYRCFFLLFDLRSSAFICGGKQSAFIRGQ
jgi:hypothetical protein